MPSGRCGGRGAACSKLTPPVYGSPRCAALAEVVTLMWSRGRRRERRDLAIRIFDMRAQVRMEGALMGCMHVRVLACQHM